MRLSLRADSSQEYLVYVPRKGSQGAPVFVTVHGISRNVQEHASLFARYARAYGVVLVAPYFTSERNHGYQRLGWEKGDRRADLVLDAILSEVGARTGASVQKFYLFGFSGGAQFAHRYTLAHPDRVAGAVIGAAGWYTFPDTTTPYPYGLASTPGLAGVPFQPEKFLRVPITVLVGQADTLDEHLRRNTDVDRQQGSTRRERAFNWCAAMKRAAEARGLESLVTCEQVPGIEHSFLQFMQEGELGTKVFGALFEPARHDGTRPNEHAPNERRGTQ